MDQMIEPRAAGFHSVEEFYDRLAPEYDVMTAMEKRFVREEPFFRLLVQRYRIGSALDAGCGTGFHSIVLASLGVRVTAVDISGRMLEELARHTAQLGLDIRTVQSQFAGLPARLGERFDAVFCMGNTLAHLLTKQELGATLESFARLLVPGGILFAQVLNYDRILLDRPHTQSVRETPRGTFIRSYEYLDDTIRFTIRTEPPPGSGGQEQTQSVELRPVRSSELSAMLVRAGFDEVQTFGSIAMEPYDATTSGDLVVLGRQGEGERT
ncbi:MAG: Methyltransferase protein [Bacteroidetes bacterium]|nr:Methyltransferase protein [Bacteroidota bacterium]